MTKKIVYSLFALILLSGCGTKIDSWESAGRQAKIFPEYEGTYIPWNIAPLNFKVLEDGDLYLVRFVVEGKDSFEVKTKGKVHIPAGKWKRLLEKNKGEKMALHIFSRKENKWTRYPELHFTIAEDDVDPYIAYRLIEPGYNAWNEMGLYQLSLESSKESPIVTNALTNGTCMNCHTFHKNSPGSMVFHIRGEKGGTVLSHNGEVRKIDTKAPWMIAAGVYPRWHPGGRYIVFSTNKTTQGFYSLNKNKIEVFDHCSDLVIYDSEENRLFTDTIIHSEKSYETFPEWSADGKELYFCSAPAMPMPDKFGEIRYSLVRVSCNPETGEFASRADTLVSAWETGKSVSLPRISPDGKRVVFCLYDFGTFPIWHPENDLYELNTETREIREMTEVNSGHSDSFHSWSSNGRWLLFSSRRMDGTYTRPYISYLDSNGNWHKPFVVPQKDPDHYDFRMKSYNLPEFITGKVTATPYELQKAWESDAVKPES